MKFSKATAAVILAAHPFTITSHFFIQTFRRFVRERDRPPQQAHRRVSSATSGVPAPAADQGGARGASAGEEKRGPGEYWYSPPGI